LTVGVELLLDLVGIVVDIDAAFNDDLSGWTPIALPILLMLL